jgi:alkanesulfonate monooxygenase SsuD/methylene tetrahydromethanopterin reductase-like flavin-dependent oxidoreductase (luciferase family)
MKVGLFLTNQHRLDKDMVTALDEQLEMARYARDHEWDSLFTGQHYLNEGNNKQLQIVPFLSRLAAEAGDMTIGLGIMLINLQNPVYVAETAASLDVIARGNFVFGVGLGYREVEFDAFRVPRGKRVARFEECLELVKRLWTGETVSYESGVCKLDGVTMNIRPVQQPHPPIWLAANNDGAVERAARLGDTWFVNPHATTATHLRQMELYRAERERLGKPMPAELPIIKELFCAEDRQTALEMCAPYLGGKYGDYFEWGQDQAMPDDESFDQTFDELLEDRFIVGSPEECYEQLRPYWEDLGVNHLIIRTHWAGMPAETALHSMRMITDELMPELRKT